MTSLLEKAFQKASNLPLEVQDELAKQLLEDIQSEQKWATAFESSQEQLGKLADKAAEDYKARRGKQAGFDEL